MERIARKNINIPSYIKKFTVPDSFIDRYRLTEMARKYVGGTFVDVGCFDSWLAPHIKENYPNERVVAIDHSPLVIKKMAERFPDVEFIVSDCGDLPFDDNSVAYLTAGEILEHTDDPEKVIAEFKRVAKQIVISVPDDELHKTPINPEEHMWSFTEKDLDNLLPGCTVELISNRLVAWYEN